MISLSSFIELIGSQSAELMAASGYPGLFILALLDRVLLSLLPSELILPVAGWLVTTGQFSFWPVLLWITVGCLLGDLLLYWLAAHGGRWLLERYGRYVLISKHDLEHTDRLFAKHGGKLVIIGRLLPIVRSFVAIPAGVAR